jgi:hypothetical protein
MWSKNYWADRESLVFLKSNFFGSEKFQVSAHVLMQEFESWILDKRV